MTPRGVIDIKYSEKQAAVYGVLHTKTTISPNELQMVSSP